MSMFYERFVCSWSGFDARLNDGTRILNCDLTETAGSVPVRSRCVAPRSSALHPRPQIFDGLVERFLHRASVKNPSTSTTVRSRSVGTPGQPVQATVRIRPFPFDR